MTLIHNYFDLIGNTPLFELKNLKKELNLKANIFAKLEYFNPAGSVKDRVAANMIKEAIKNGIINKNTTIIEPTSGNTGIGLASIAAVLGYKIILTMPETMSIERRKLLSAYGAELVLTDGAKGMKGAIEKANELASTISDSFIPSQFENPANPDAHYKTTGPEIYNDMNGKIDIFISAVGTGGTLSGCAKFLKEKNNNIEIIAVEPDSSAVLSAGITGPHKIQGIGAGFVPKTLDTNIYDKVMRVSNEDAFKYTKMLPKKEGILVGISSGAALSATVKIALEDENIDKNIVAIFPDTGERYLSSELFD